MRTGVTQHVSCIVSMAAIDTDEAIQDNNRDDLDANWDNSGEDRE